MASAGPLHFSCRQSDDAAAAPVCSKFCFVTEVALRMEAVADFDTMALVMQDGRMFKFRPLRLQAREGFHPLAN